MPRQAVQLIARLHGGSSGASGMPVLVQMLPGAGGAGTEDWQCALVGLETSVALLGLRRARPQTRYIAACAGLVILGQELTWADALATFRAQSGMVFELRRDPIAIERGEMHVADNEIGHLAACEGDACLAVGGGEHRVPERPQQVGHQRQIRLVILNEEDARGHTASSVGVTR